MTPAMTACLEGGAPARIVVDLDAIAHNVGVLRRHAGAAEVMAVVKGDAYGHGLVPVARTSLAAGATWLGVAQLREALALRAAGITAPVLAWLHAPDTDYVPAVEQGVDLGVPTAADLERVVAAARAAGRPARVHLKVDTGLARNGAYGPQWPQLVQAAVRAQSEGGVRVVGVFTHFAFADAPTHPTVVGQQERFAAAVRDCESAGLDLEVRHMANSAATLTTPSAAWDLVRPGLAIYGLSPLPDLGDSAHFGLRPAMTVTADVTVTKQVPAGQGVSYGHTYVTPAPTTLADIPIGYVDGVPRSASSRGPVSIGGRRFTVSGRVCMDQFVVDVGDAPVRAGDTATLFGDPAAGVPSAQEWADAAGTISYEIVARMSANLPRVHRGGAGA